MGMMKSVWHRLWVGTLHLIVTVASVLAVGIAADYGIGPVYAAVALPQQVSEQPRLAEEQMLLASADWLLPPEAQYEPRFAVSKAPIGADPKPGFRRLPGHVLDAVQNAKLVGANGRAGRSRMTLTVTLNRDDQSGFEHYLAEIYDSNSAEHGNFLTQAQLADRFGPSRSTYSQVAHYLQGHGLKVTARSKNRLTMTVRGTRQEVQRIFAIGINDYRLGDRNFYANDADPAVPAALAPAILDIQGLSDLARPERIINSYPNPCSSSGSNVTKSITSGCQTYLINACGGLLIGGVQFSLYSSAFGGLGAGLIAIVVSLACFGWVNSISVSGEIQHAELGRGAAAAALGAGQTIGLLEFDNYTPSDVSNFLTLIGASSAQINNLSQVAVNGGTSPGANQDEVLLDVDMVMTGAPGAKVVVYDAPFSGQAASYTAMFNAMLNGGVNIISNSWASCEDQISAAEAQSIDSVLQSAAAGGVTVFNGAGDSGSTCLDGSANTVAVPADSPSATAVGGSSPSYGPGATYGSETWWNGANATPATGQGGFGVSKFFAQPSYQKAAFSSTGRSVPDVVAEADPAQGIFICEAAAGGCPTGLLYGGTSLATPIWAVYAAILNQDLGKNLGSFNPLLYPLANTAAFHNAASLGSDTAHVGLGSASLGNLKRLLSNQTVGTPSGSASQAQALLPATSIVSATLPADGTTQGGVLVTLLDANHNLVSGKTVTLTSSSSTAVITPASGVSSSNEGSVAFTVTDTVVETVQFSATDTTDGVPVTQTANLKFVAPPAAGASITANPATVALADQNASNTEPAATVIVTLKDSQNRPTPGKTVSVSTGGSHAAVTGPTPPVTDANGQIQFSATDQVAESVTFTAVDVTDGNLAVPGSATVTYSGSANTACGVGVVPVAGTGYAITPYITGFAATSDLTVNGTNLYCAGANPPAFTSSGTVLVTDAVNGKLYQLGLGGGAISGATLISTGGQGLGGLIYGKDGSAYVAQGGRGGAIYQINPVTGAQIRTVASNLTCPAGFAIDPLSGDLFFDDDCSGGGTNDATVYRVIDPANANPSSPTTVVPYATLASTANGGLAFAPNGTLYAVTGYYGNPSAAVQQVSGTNVSTVTVTTLTGITSDFGVAIGVTNADGSAQSLIVEPNGSLQEVPIANPSTAIVLATGSPGVGVTGPDGCLYSVHYDTVYRLAPSSGTCTFAPSSPAPSLKLTPPTVSPNPAQGTAQTFTAQLQNVSSQSGVSVIFTVNGANPQTKLVQTSATGAAALTYTAAQAGSDTITATATTGSTSLGSNAVNVTWTAGKHTSLLSMNASPQGGTVNTAVTVSASLYDGSASPLSAVPSQTVTFTLGSSSCTATTNAAGLASCSLTPAQIGLATLTANFSGNSTYVAATQSIGFATSAAPVPAPTVTLTASPTTIAAGSSSTLTWSTTNATACAASGAWSGSEATSGSQSVTPASTGSFSYTLTCTGNGGSAAATAVVSATLVAVTVSAHSGGGALTWPLILVLGVLLMVRFGGMRRAARRRGSVRLAALSVAYAVGTSIFLMSGPVRADAPTSAAGGSADWLDPFYAGIRFGGMATRLNAGNIDSGLAALGYPAVTASTAGESKPAGTVYIGYELAPHADVEFGYTHRSANVATLSGNVASTANIMPLLQDTTELIRGYGDVYSLSFRPRVEIGPRLMLDPRVGAFLWDTKTTVQTADVRFDHTHEGGGLTVGAGIAYRVWRGLELGAGVDFYRGVPNNIATLYAATLEWRFGH